MKKTLIITLLLIVTLTPLQAQGSSPASIIAADPNLSVLFQAASAAGLEGRLAGDVTVFAPTNGAFGTLLNDLGLTQAQLLADTNLLQTVLAYHVVSGRFSVGDVLNAGSVDLTTLSGETLNAGYSNNRVRLNNGAAITIQPNRFGDVGVVHVIDNVLLPPSAASLTAPAPPQLPGVEVVTAPPNTILSVTASNPDLSLFNSAVEAAGLTDTLAGPGPFTALVPTNSAFQTFLTDLSLTESSLLQDTSLLRTVLTYHVLPDRLLYDDLYTFGATSLGPSVNGTRLQTNLVTPQTVPTVNGARLAVSIRGSQIILANGRASVIATDFTAPNGVVHLIDNVMVP